MSNFADWTTLTYVNGTTPAISATNLNKNENALENVMGELNYSSNWSLNQIKRYSLMNGQKKIIDLSDYTDWSTSGTITASNIYTAPMGAALKMLETDNSSGTLWAWQSGLSTIDLATMESGRASATTDFITFHFYISDATYITSVGVRFGDDSSNFFYYSITSASYSTGWNTFGLRKTDFSSTGSPAGWDSINYISFYVNTAANAQNEYFAIDSLFLVQNDSVNGVYQPWWLEDGSGNFDVEYYMDSAIDTLIYQDYLTTKLGFNILYTDGSNMAEILCTVNSFSVKAEIYSRAAGFGGTIRWFVTSSDYIDIDVRSSSLVIYEYLSGSGTDEVTVALDYSIAYGDRMELFVDKVGDVIRAELHVDGQRPVYAAWETGFDADESGCVGFIRPNSGQEYFVTDFVVGHNQANLPPFLANGLFLTKVKINDESLSSLDTLQSDDELTLKLPPYSFFEVEVLLGVDGTDTGQDITVAWQATGCTQISYRYCNGPGENATSLYNADAAMYHAFNTTTEATYGVVASGWSYIRENCLISTGFGPCYITVRWCQGTSSATAIVMKKLSSIRAKKIY